MASEIVAAHCAISQIIVGAFLDAPIDDLVRDFRIGERRQAAETAAGRQLRAAKFAQLDAESGSEAPHRALRVDCVATGAGIVDGKRTRERRPSAVRPADLVDHGPQRARLHLGQEFAQRLQAGRTGGDDLRFPEAAPSLAQTRGHLVVQRAPAAPQRRRAAAIDHEADAAGDLRGEMGVDALDVPGRRRRQLAAGEEGDGAFCAAGLAAGEGRRRPSGCAPCRAVRNRDARRAYGRCRPCRGAPRGRPRPWRDRSGTASRTSPHNVQLSIMRLALRRPMTMLMLL